MRWPHWLRCRWSDWDEVESVMLNVRGPFNMETVEAMVQRRTCSVCKKVDSRKIRAA